MSPRSRTLFLVQRRIVFERSEGRCEKCGQTLATVWECHHRRLRSQGGDDSVCNLLALHSDCHNAGSPGSVHSRPGLSYGAGYLVRRFLDPRDVPVLLHGRRWVLLTSDGHYHPTVSPAIGDPQ
jgi:hypothetical protein